MDQSNFSVIELSKKETPSSTEIIKRGTDYVSFGPDNKYPNFLYENYTNCPSLQTIINGTTDYVCGEGTKNEFINSLGENLDDIIRKMALTLQIYGGVFIRVKRDALLKIKDLLILDYKNCRVNDDISKIYYSKEWGKWGSKAEVFKSYNEKLNDSILFYRGLMISDAIYPLPRYQSAIKSCLTETEIQNFHYNSILNFFAVGKLINFNNGDPDPVLREQIKEGLNQEFTGTDNPNKFMVSFNSDKEHAVTVETLNDDDFDERYSALWKSTKNTIYGVMQAQPVLFGNMLENIGFNQQEFESAFTLYNTTVVSPLQNKITKILNTILKEEIVIEPFTMKK